MLPTLRAALGAPSSRPACPDRPSPSVLVDYETLRPLVESSIVERSIALEAGIGDDPRDPPSK